MANVSFLHPPPVTAQHTDQNGNVTPAWQKWYQQLYLRTGGQTAISNASLSNNSSQIISATLSSNQSTIYTSPAGVTTVIDSFSITNKDIIAHSVNVWTQAINASPVQVITNLSILPGVTTPISTLVSQVIGSGGLIIAQANQANCILIQANGRQTS